MNDLEKTRLPAANAAEAIVSPSKPVIFQPANVNYGLFPPLSSGRLRGREKRLALAARALDDLAPFLREAEVDVRRAA